MNITYNAITIIEIGNNGKGNLLAFYEIEVKEKSLPSAVNYTLTGAGFNNSFINNGVTNKDVNVQSYITQEDRSTISIPITFTGEIMDCNPQSSMIIQVNGDILNGSSDVIESLDLNTAAGLTPGFLIKDILRKSGVRLYTRYFEAQSLSLPGDTVDHLLHSTVLDVSVVNKTAEAITYASSSDGTSVTLNIPSLEKTIGYEILNSDGMVVATLKEEEIDGSDVLKIPVTSLTNGTEVTFKINIMTRLQNDRNVSATSSNEIRVTPNSEQCSNCSTKASCVRLTDGSGDIICTCNNGFGGDGTTCDFITTTTAATTAATTESDTTTAVDSTTAATSQPSTTIADPTTAATSQPSTTIAEPTTAATSQPSTTIAEPSTAETSQPSTTISEPTTAATFQPSTTITEPTTAATSQPSTTIAEPTTAATFQPTTTIAEPTTAATSQPSTAITEPTTAATSQPSTTIAEPTTAATSQPSTTIAEPTTAATSQPSTTIAEPTTAATSQPSTTIAEPTTAATSQPSTTIAEPTTAATSQPSPTIAEPTTAATSQPPTTITEPTTAATSQSSTTSSEPSTAGTFQPSTTNSEPTTAATSQPPTTNFEPSTAETSQPSTTITEPTTAATSQPRTTITEATPTTAKPATDSIASTTVSESSTTTTNSQSVLPVWGLILIIVIGIGLLGVPIYFIARHCDNKQNDQEKPSVEMWNVNGNHNRQENPYEEIN
uniref:mucin-5AC-like n=1 Tax=Styela clava TaxID=7725 RepID=UPI00193A18A8|nr:mucin-5AC-like [Styela clava]